MPQTYRIALELDADDFDAVQRAMSVRQGFRVMPEGGGNLAGRLVAEIARGWLEMVEREPRQEGETQ